MAINLNRDPGNVDGAVVRRSLSNVPVNSRERFYEAVKGKTEDEIVEYVKTHRLNFLENADPFKAAVKIRKFDPNKENQEERSTSTTLTRSIVILPKGVVFRTSKGADGLSRPGDEPCDTGLLGGGVDKEVWKTRNLCNGEFVAVAQATQRTGLFSIKNEYEVTQQINSPHILKVESYGVLPQPQDVYHPRRGYAVSELCQSSLLRMPLQDLRQHPEFIRQIDEAFQAVHAAGFSHNDGHRGNLFIDRNGRVRLADFGRAERIPDHLKRQPNTPWRDLTMDQRNAFEADQEALDGILDSSESCSIRGSGYGIAFPDDFDSLVEGGPAYDAYPPFYQSPIPLPVDMRTFAEPARGRGFLGGHRG